MTNTIQKNMKKGIAILLVVTAMVLCLAGCGGKKATAVVTFENFESGTLAMLTPTASAGLERNVLTVNVPDEGVYPFLILTKDSDFSFVLTYENGVFSGEADTGVTFTIK